MKTLRLFLLALSMLVSQLATAQIDLQTIAVTNCTCAQFADGLVKIPNVPTTTVITLQRIETTGNKPVDAVRVNTDIEFNGLVAGSYILTAKDASGNSVSHQISVTQPGPIEFSIDAPTNLPDANGTNGSVKVNYAGPQPFTIFYKGESDQSYKQLDNLLTISALKAGQYDVYMKVGKCTSQNQTVVLSAKDMFSLSWHEVGFCKANFPGLEAEVSFPRSENINLTFTYNGANMGSPDPVSQTPNTKRVRLKWQGYGKYVLAAVGTPATRVVQIEVDAANSKCGFTCQVSPGEKPTPANGGKGSFTITILNPLPNDYSVLVTSNGKEILKTKDTRQSTFAIAGARGTYDYEVVNQSNNSRCTGSYVLDVDIPATATLRQQYLENIAIPIHRDLVLCDCFIKRVEGWDLTLTAVSTVPLFFTPLMSSKAVIALTAIGSGLVNTTNFLSLKGKRYDSFVKKRDQLLSIVKLHNEIMTVFANGNLSYDDYAKYDSLKGIITQKIKELPEIDNPNCADNRFTKLMTKQLPDGVTDMEKKLYIESRTATSKPQVD